MESNFALPTGFLGTRGDILMDLVILSFLFILPAMLASWRLARKRQYVQHKRWQLSLFAVLLIAVLLFELDLKLSGGIFALTAESRYAGTALLNSIIYGHTAVAIAAALLWIAQVALSLMKFGSPPAPNSFSSTHRALGRAGMLTMTLTGISAFPLYILGFAL